MEILGQDKREGLGRRANSRFVLMLLTLVSSVMLLSSLYGAEASVFKKARETVINASAPLLAFFSVPIALVQDVAGNVGDYFGALEQNKALREENADLRQWMQEALELRKILAAYEGLQSFHAPPEISPIDAFVVGESNDVYARSMIVNAGYADGVRADHAVVDDAGLVGHIVDVGTNSARVLLLTDLQSRIPVIIDEANVDGILTGRSQGRPVIEFTNSDEPVDLVAGQRVLTSGAGGALPAGLPVGVIHNIADNVALVDLYANYARTRMVRVMNYQFAELGPEDLLTNDVEESRGAGEDVEAQPARIEDATIAPTTVALEEE